MHKHAETKKCFAHPAATSPRPWCVSNTRLHETKSKTPHHDNHPTQLLFFFCARARVCVCARVCVRACVCGLLPPPLCGAIVFRRVCAAFHGASASAGCQRQHCSRCAGSLSVSGLCLDRCFGAVQEAEKKGREKRGCGRERMCVCVCVEHILTHSRAPHNHTHTHSFSL